MARANHWTETSVEDFQFAVALDFIDQVEAKMDAEGMSQADLAKRLNVSEGRVSQIINNPGNLTLHMMTKCSRAVGMKFSVVAYDDGDTENRRGPINSKVFEQCWRASGRPVDAWSLPTARSSPHASTGLSFFGLGTLFNTGCSFNNRTVFSGSYLNTCRVTNWGASECIAFHAYSICHDVFQGDR